MKKTILVLIVFAASLSGCATQCCTPNGYGYYYRPAYATPACGVAAAPAYYTSAPVYMSPAHASHYPYAGGYYY